ncbi:uncharacterized protein [Lolium perenne]|uniref:uncharacterized protein n=1 Tax=Lolium perenne TaxID=4522 RepID=UPI0021F66435|nr:uncharacterized protein LOC127327927 isoform X2 [Lolium perenne]
MLDWVWSSLGHGSSPGSSSSSFASGRGKCFSSSMNGQCRSSPLYPGLLICHSEARLCIQDSSSVIQVHVVMIQICIREIILRKMKRQLFPYGAEKLGKKVL